MELNKKLLLKHTLFLYGFAFYIIILFSIGPPSTLIQC